MAKHSIKVDWNPKILLLKKKKKNGNHIQASKVFIYCKFPKIFQIIRSACPRPGLCLKKISPLKFWRQKEGIWVILEVNIEYAGWRPATHCNKTLLFQHLRDNVKIHARNIYFLKPYEGDYLSFRVSTKKLSLWLTTCLEEICTEATFVWLGHFLFRSYVYL